MNTDDSVTRKFCLHQKILLQINSLSYSYYGHLARFISSLTWYNNGTELLSSDRVNVSNHGTSLTISDMIDSDAGKYEVKISSIHYYNYVSSATCDRNILRMLEQTAVHAPVTFYLQQYHIPQYKPEDIIKLYFFSVNTLANSNITVTINYTTDVNTNFIFGKHAGFLSQMFIRNGVSQSSNTDKVKTKQSYNYPINISHNFRHNNIDEIVGDYFYMETAFSFRNNCYSSTFRYNCSGYYYYFVHYTWPVSVLAHYWSLKISKTKEMHNIKAYLTAK